MSEEIISDTDRELMEAHGWRTVKDLLKRTEELDPKYSDRENIRLGDRGVATRTIPTAVARAFVEEQETAEQAEREAPERRHREAMEEQARQHEKAMKAHAQQHRDAMGQQRTNLFIGVVVAFLLGLFAERLPAFLGW